MRRWRAYSLLVVTFALATAACKNPFTLDKHLEAHDETADLLDDVPACRRIEKGHREYCPLEEIEIIQRVLPTEDGIRVILDAEQIGGLGDLEKHAYCQAGYGVFHGRDDAMCPFYLPDLALRLEGPADSASVSLSSRNPKTQRALKLWRKSLPPRVRR